MPPILRQQIAWEEVDIFSASLAALSFHPEEVFHMSLWRCATGACRFVEMPDLIFEPSYEFAGGFAVGCQVKMLDLLPDNPIGHRIDIVSYDIASQPIRFNEWRSSTHERVRNPNAF